MNIPLRVLPSCRSILPYVFSGAVLLSARAYAQSGNPVFHVSADRPGVSTIPAHYPSLDSINRRIITLVNHHPHLARLDTIGHSATLKLPLLAIKLSDNAHKREDESTLLITALHHAREPAGMLAAIAVAESLLTTYPNSPASRMLLDNLAIWFVPVVNPDGYRYMHEHEFSMPWWRKNMRDNDGDGRMNPSVDGVDLNRNYDFNWQDGDGVQPLSWFYRGDHPGSEPEVAAVQKLALRENIAAGLSLHSYGEAVLYPWGNFYPPPDQKMIITLAQRLGQVMRKQSDGTAYRIWPLNGRAGQSSVWMYGRLRALDYILEIGTTWFPPVADLQRIEMQLWQAVEVLGRAVLFEGIGGHVLDAATGQPLVCEIRVQGLEAGYVAARVSEPVWGRFERILQPGRYTVSFFREGYQPYVRKDVKVNSGAKTNFTVYLHRTAGR